MQLTGARLTAQECEKHHIIQKACTLKELLPDAIAFAKSLNKRREVIAEMKKRMNNGIVNAIDVEDVPYLEALKLKLI